MPHSSDTLLIRGIRKWDLLALVLNGIIGAGIFGLPSKVYALVGNYSLLAFFCCAILVALFVLCFAELGSRFSETGGPYLYARQAFGSVVAFEVGWLLWLARLTAFAALCNLLVDYLGYFVPGATGGAWRVVVIVGVVGLLASINLIGVRDAAIVSDVFTIGKLIPLVLFVSIGAFFVRAEQFRLGPVPDVRAFSQAMLPLVFAFSGFEAAGAAAGEMLNPRRHMPFALILGITIVAMLYIAVQAVCIGTLPDLANSQRPLADAASRFVGSVGAAVIAIGAIVSITGTLNSIMLIAPRLLFAMADQGQLPRALAVTHARFHTPHFAILASAAVMLVVTLNGSFISQLTISTIIRLICFAVVCAALPVLRRNSAAPPASFRVPAGSLVAAAALVLIVWLLAQSSGAEARAAGISAGLGMVLLLIFRGLRLP